MKLKSRHKKEKLFSANFRCLDCSSLSLYVSLGFYVCLLITSQSKISSNLQTLSVVRPSPKIMIFISRLELMMVNFFLHNFISQSRRRLDQFHCPCMVCRYIFGLLNKIRKTRLYHVVPSDCWPWIFFDSSETFFSLSFLFFNTIFFHFTNTEFSHLFTHFSRKLPCNP